MVAFTVADLTHMAKIVVEETQRAQRDFAEYARRVAEFQIAEQAKRDKEEQHLRSTREAKQEFARQEAKQQ